MVSSLSLDNSYLQKWVEEVHALCTPDSIHICDGSDNELQKIQSLLVAHKTFIPLNPELRPNSFLARSNPDDVARVEDKTFICSERESDAGPTNNWQDPKIMKKTLSELFSGCMKGRCMYIIPFCMGPVNSPHSKVSVQITDSAYVVASMAIMTRMGKHALDMLGKKNFVKCLHSVGRPIQPGEKDDPWPCNPKNLYISHFPETKEVWSFGSGYGGNALLNKKCFALRLASKMAQEEGWLAEHMLIVGITNPEGVKRYFAASFPSACGKTNLAMLTSALPGWKVECVGDDIAWMHWGNDGRLYAINPESGFFGVAPGTSMKSNPNAMRSFEKNSIFTNVALTDNNDIWWEQMTAIPPKHLINWKDHDWTPESTEKAAHPNARFTAPIRQCPVVDPLWESKEGVPISGIIFGGRRSHVIPLVREALSWEHGVFLGASMTSEMTAAAKGEVGKVRNDPFAMLPFCGYHMGDYFAHWLSMNKPGRILPKIFYVNWFQKDSNSNFIWPGFGDNIRVLKWCFERIENKAFANQTPVGYLPRLQDLDLQNITLTKEASELLLHIDEKGFKEEAEQLLRYFEQFGQKLPEVIQREVQKLLQAYS